MKKLFKYTLLGIFSIFIFMNISWTTGRKYAKIKDFNLCHKERTIKEHWSYKQLNKLTDSELKNACTNPSDKNYITVKSGTFELRDGNTRVFLMKERGFEDFQVPYDEINTGNFCDFY